MEKKPMDPWRCFWAVAWLVFLFVAYRLVRELFRG